MMMFSCVFADGEMICVDAVDTSALNFDCSELLNSKFEFRNCCTTRRYTNNLSLMLQYNIFEINLKMSGPGCIDYQKVECR